MRKGRASQAAPLPMSLIGRRGEWLRNTSQWSADPREICSQKNAAEETTGGGHLLAPLNRQAEAEGPEEGLPEWTMQARAACRSRKAQGAAKCRLRSSGRLRRRHDGLCMRCCKATIDTLVCIQLTIPSAEGEEARDLCSVLG